MRTLTLSLLALSTSSATLVAQATSCGSGPGAQLGVIGFQCANCSFVQDERFNRTTYVFSVEPVVTQAVRGSGIVSGDVIIAVDSLPITTRAGAERFAFPAAGTHRLTVRRGRGTQDLVIPVEGCRGTSSSSSSSSGSSRGSGSNSASGHGSASSSPSSAGSGSSSASADRFFSAVGRGEGQSVLGGAQLVVTNDGSGQRASIQGAPIFVVDGEVVRDQSIGRFGFATECRPSCSAKQLANNHYIIKYDGYPVVVAIRERSSAGDAGVQVGDIILSVNGKSILADDALEGATERDDLHLTVRRDGREVSLRLRKP